ncbi:hypothetical protein V9T40_004385 [Parthenolecanium corni]|uniref:UBX domain-containing protein n=1 Tax=Parthenolecanium corni TaxID=536013 RepID=A0AAN9YAP8_9HEMI
MNNLDFPLDHEQTEKILQFQDLTGIEDIALCRDVLQRHNWDLETAVQDQLNIKEGRPSVYSVSRPASDELPVVHSDPSVQQVFVAESPALPFRWRWTGTVGLIASFLFRFVYNTFASFFEFARSFFWNRPRYPEVTDPIGDVLNFINKFEETFGRRHPVFYQGTYAQALNDAKLELRFLIVYLHSDSQDCSSFCRNTLTSEDMIDFLDSHAVIFWSCSVETGEGRRVVHALHAKKFPFIGVIILRENVMTLVARLEGLMDSPLLISRLQSVIANNEPILYAARASRMERILNQSIREQQDEAYMESLRADQEKQRQRELEREEIRKIELEKERLIQEELMKKLELENQKTSFLARIPDEPATSHPNCVCISFKMPNGQRLERRFLSTHTLQDVYYYVFCNPDLSGKFEIATNFPKKVLDCSMTSIQTLEEAGLRKREVLFVYDLES